MKVFLINSTVNQLVLVRELIHDLGLDPQECVAVIRKANKWTTRRFVIYDEAQVREFGEWHKVYLIPQWVGRNFPTYIVNFISYVLRARSIVNKYKPDMLIVGNYLNEPMRHIASLFVSQMPVMFLDEGLSTVNIMDERRKFFNGGKDRKSGFIASLIKNRLLGFKTGHVAGPITFYSLLNLSDDAMTRIRLCAYNRLRAELPPATIENAMFFLGGPFAEWGYMTREESSLLFSKVKEDFPGLPIVYFPHPLENLFELRKWAEEQTFEIRVVDRPFELHLYEQPVRPMHIASYYSYGVISCVHLFTDQLNYHFYEIPNNLLRKSNENVATMYRFITNTYRDNSHVTFHSWSGEFGNGGRFISAGS